MGNGSSTPPRAWLRALALLCVFVARLAGAAEFQGLTLEQAIDSLRRDGVTILYSSDVVKPWMRVRDEPAGTGPREWLAQMLAPYGLSIETGPRDALMIVRGDAPSPPPSVAAAAAEPAPESRVSATELNELVITASQYELTRGAVPPAAVMAAADLDFIPNPGNDPLRAATRLPGTANPDYTAKTNVRGGEVDEMLVRFDGLRLYNPFHLKDFQSVFSAIDPGITQQMNVYTGGFPSTYGDRMSSVIDIASLPPVAQATRELSLTLFNASALARGGFADGDGDWLVSARRGNLDMFFDIANSDLGEPSYLDVYARAGRWITDAFAVSGNILLFDDDILLYESKQREESARADYRDAYGWLRLDFVPGERLAGNLIWARTELESRRAGSTDQPGVATGSLQETKDFSIDSLQTDWSWHAAERLDLNFGAQLTLAEGEYRYRDDAEFALLFLTPGAATNPVRETDLSLDVDGDYFGAYLNARYRVTRKLVAEAGLRWDKETVSAAEAGEFSPRFALLYAPGNATELRASWGRYYQSELINELQLSDGVTRFAPPQRADHLVLGLDHAFGSGVTLRVEAYHKRYGRLRPRFENFLNPLVLLPELKPDRVRIAPQDSTAKGLEATLRLANHGPWSGWLSYVWASVEDDVGDATLRRAWDQTHSLRLGLGWRGERWEFSGVGTYHTGWPTTIVALAADAPVPLVATDARNDARLGSFASADLRVARHFRFSDTHSLSVFVEAVNLFNRSNDCCIEYEVDDETGELTLETEPVDSLRFIPSAGFVWRF